MRIQVEDIMWGDIARFWSKVGVGWSGDCWEWKGRRKHKGGYATFTIGAKCSPSHRVAYMIRYGEITKGLDIRHICDNPSCCNPNHLEEGTRKQNMEDMVKRGRSATGDKSPRNLHPESYPVGENFYKAKLTVEQVRQMRIDYKNNKITYRLLGKAYGITAATAFDAVTRRSWRHVL